MSIIGQDELTLTPMATFSGLRRVPLLALSHNGLFPRLVIGPRSVTIRVLRTHEIAYGDLVDIHLHRRLGHRLTFEPRRGWRNFTVSFAGRDMAAGAVRALVDRGAPVAPDALDLLG